jgi:hypothetical protein
MARSWPTFPPRRSTPWSPCPGRTPRHRRTASRSATWAALARPVPGGGAQPSIDASYLLYAAGATPTPDLAGPVRAHVQAVKDALAPWHASYDYYNFEDTRAAAPAVLPPASARRLQEIKAAYDPGQVIISADPVWPARPRPDAPRHRQP